MKLYCYTCGKPAGTADTRIKGLTIFRCPVRIKYRTKSTKTSYKSLEFCGIHCALGAFYTLTAKKYPFLDLSIRPPKGSKYEYSLFPFKNKGLVIIGREKVYNV